MGGFRNAQNNKPQRKMWPAPAAYKSSVCAMKIDAYIVSEIVVAVSQQVELEVVIRLVEYCHKKLP